MPPPTSADRLPPLTNDPLTVVAPFAFEGLSARVFPLRASLNALQRLCNAFLNFIPPSVGRFRVVSPYVYLMLLDYGKLGDLLANLGWFAQKEVLFCFPVQWYRVDEQGRWIFHDWASITPYIYVDDDVSVPMGRTVYGWPKSLARLTPTLSGWMDDPRSPIDAATLSTMVFPELYEGSRLESRVLLQVRRAAPTSALAFPFDSGSPLAPWSVQASVARNLRGWTQDFFSLMAGWGLYPNHPGADPTNLTRMMEGLGRALGPGGWGLISNTINLKQFRDAGDPREYCYQGLTNGRIRTTALHNFGFLGEDRTFSGDLTGGYRIELHEWPSLPIAQALGLEVERRWQGQGPTVAELAPVLPFWYEVDMEYLAGENLVWRTDDRVWRDEDSEPVPVEDDDGLPPSLDGLFNTTVGSSVDALAGPFQFSGTTIRVLPLLAFKDVLERFLDGYVNDLLPGPDDGAQVRLSLWAAPDETVDYRGYTHETDGDLPGGPFAYVYLTATSFGHVTSRSNNIGDWAKYEVSFLVPVKWERFDGERWVTEGVGVLPAFTLVDDTTAAIARSEVTGIPTMHAIFDRPDSAWMGELGSDPDAPQRLLRVVAEVMPAIGEGRQATFHTVLDISDGDTSLDEETGLEDRNAAERDARVQAERWAAVLRQELARKKATKRRLPRSVVKSARALALEILGDRTPVMLYTLKQFRDVVDPSRACYQAVLRVPRTLDEVLDVSEMEQVIRVRLHDFPSLSIVESLGIVGKATHDDVAGIVTTTQAIRPFSLRVTMNEELGERILSRAGHLGWRAHLRSEDAAPWSEDGGALRSRLSGRIPINVTGLAEKQQDIADPRRVCRTVGKWETSARPGSDLGRVEVEMAHRVVASVDPQMVVESLLSREWGSWDVDARWQQGLRELRGSYDLTLTGVADDWVQTTEQAYFRGTFESLRDRPGQPSVAVAEGMIEQLGRFTALRLDVEREWSVLVTMGLEREFGAHLLGLRPRPPVARRVRDNIAGLLQGLRGILQLHEQVETISIGPYHDDVDERLTELLDSIEGRLRARLSALPPQRIRLDSPTFQDLLEETWRVRDSLREAVLLARSLCELQMDTVLHKLARAWQKPDFCVNRNMVGAHAERLFPRAESWDDDWYYGPEAEPEERARRGGGRRRR